MEFMSLNGFGSLKMKQMCLILSPGTALLIVFLALVLFLWMFWPRKGLLAQLVKIRMYTRRVLLEDALKFLYDCEYRGIPCDLNSIARRLNLSVDRSGKLLDRLCAMDLVFTLDQTFRLTDAGRSYSLRVIRVHRIWERYLADETGITQAEWHEKADYLEHRIAGGDVDKLAVRMGNPVFDPHGDPIPTSAGDLPVYKGKPLSHLKEGDLARIVHIEDEPVSVYEQLVVLGLYPGMQVYVLNVEKDKIVFAADGEECTLTPLFASGITVELLTGKVIPATKQELLSSLAIGENAEITGISPNCRGQQRRRLMDLGIVPGSTISAIIKSASGDPVGYRVMGTTIGIRKSQANLIFIKRKERNGHEYSK